MTRRIPPLLNVYSKAGKTVLCFLNAWKPERVRTNTLLRDRRTALSLHQGTTQKTANVKLVLF